MRLLFARHGESEANVQQIISNRDLPHHLTRTDIAQAMALADRVTKEPVKAIWASPIVRVQETASIVAERLGLSFATAPALREFDCGRMEGRGDEEAWAAHHAVTQAWDEAHDYDRRIEPDGESFNDMQTRFLPFVTGLFSQTEQTPGDILLISHGALLHLLLPILLNNIDRTFTKQHPLGNCDLVIVQRQTEQLLCTEWSDIKLT
ncbi:MAG: histidine phosphatase family protein [Caldilineaceae bacterium]